MDHKGELVTFERAYSHLLQQSLLHAYDGNKQNAAQTEGQSEGEWNDLNFCVITAPKVKTSSREQKNAYAVFIFVTVLLLQT